MDEQQLSPEELIRGMAADEICELLEAMGITVTAQQAVSLQGLINRLGSLDAAFAALSDDHQGREVA
ncbi:hypothetical protein SH139x_002902 [Planctomycetaceae bacterium SH139]